MNGFLKSEKRIDSSLAFVFLLMLFSGVAACKSKPSSGREPEKLLTGNSSNLQKGTSPQEDSCRAFVQGFYDWYINPYLNSSHGIAWYEVARRKPEILSDELRKMLIAEDQAMAKTGEINVIDFDPFLNSQDPSDKYVVVRIQVEKQKCNAIVKGSSEVRPELVFDAGNWRFINFHYSFYSEDRKRKEFPDNDLVNMLKPKR